MKTRDTLSILGPSWAEPRPGSCTAQGVPLWRLFNKYLLYSFNSVWPVQWHWLWWPLGAGQEAKCLNCSEGRVRLSLQGSESLKQVVKLLQGALNSRSSSLLLLQGWVDSLLHQRNGSSDLWRCLVSPVSSFKAVAWMMNNFFSGRGSGPITWNYIAGIALKTP